MKPPRRKPRRAGPIAGAACLALLILIVATARGADKRLYPPRSGEAVAIWLIDNGVHSDIVVPRALIADRNDPLALALRRTTDRTWVALGWGDAGFYTASGFSTARVLDGLRALFAPGNPSVVHIEGLPGRPDRIYHNGVRLIFVSPAGLRAMVGRVDSFLALDAAGAPIPAGLPSRPDDRFFRSVEHFSVLHVCNHWVAELLAAAGLPVTPVIDILPAGLNLDLQLRASHPAPGAGIGADPPAIVGEISSAPRSAPRALCAPR
jgi:hypothetical protein